VRGKKALQAGARGVGQGGQPQPPQAPATPRAAPAFDRTGNHRLAPGAAPPLARLAATDPGEPAGRQSGCFAIQALAGGLARPLLIEPPLKIGPG
jgi:hypothetical protein